MAFSPNNIFFFSNPPSPTSPPKLVYFVRVFKKIHLRPPDLIRKIKCVFWFVSFNFSNKQQEIKLCMKTKKIELSCFRIIS